MPSDCQRVRFCLCQIDQGPEIFGGQVTTPHQQARDLRHHCDRCEVGDRIVWQRRIECRVDRVAAEADEQRVSVGRRFRDRSRG